MDALSAFSALGRDTMPKEDLVRMLEDLGIGTSSGFVAKEIAALTREDGSVSLPRSSSHLFTRATQGRVAIPAWNEFTSVIAEIAEGVRRDVTGGANADYIQVLRDADPTKFAVSVVTVDGQRFNHGDFRHSYSIQSCCKPLTYAIAVDEAGGASGLPYVHSHVGSEASGLAFNSISVNDAGLPHNPMVNAGAIASVGLVGRHCPDLSSRFAYLMARYKDIAGDTEVGFSEATYLCELETAWRNNAILYTLSEAGVFSKQTHPYATLDLYIQACATEVNTETAAMMAATFANGGVQPTTGERVLSTAAVKAALTLCFSCGLYDGSGTWAVNVGLPAKSGVAGLIYVIIPGVAGVAVFSPPLDEHGNSFRGVAFCERLVRTFPFGLFDKAVADVLTGLSPPIDPRMLYLPPHLRRAKAVIEELERRRRRAARRAGKHGGLAAGASPSRSRLLGAGVAGGMPAPPPGLGDTSGSSVARAAPASGTALASDASVSLGTLPTAMDSLGVHESDDSDDDSAWAEAVVARAQALGLSVTAGIDYSAAFRLAPPDASEPGATPRSAADDDGTSLAPVAPALLLSHSLSASFACHGAAPPVNGDRANGSGNPPVAAMSSAGRDTSRHFTSAAIHKLQLRLTLRHVIQRLGQLWKAFVGLRDWAPDEFDVRRADSLTGRGRGSASGTGRSASSGPSAKAAHSGSARGANGSAGPSSRKALSAAAVAGVGAAAAGAGSPDSMSKAAASQRSLASGASVLSSSFKGAVTAVRVPNTRVDASEMGIGAELFVDIAEVPPNAIETWRLASFLASKGIACTHRHNPRIATLLTTLSKGTGLIHFKDVVLSSSTSADTLLTRALLRKLVVHDFDGVRQSIMNMANAVMRYVPPVPVLRDGTIPPSAVAAFHAAKAGATATTVKAGAHAGRSRTANADIQGVADGGLAGIGSAADVDAEDVLEQAKAASAGADPLYELRNRSQTAGGGAADAKAVPPAADGGAPRSKVDVHRDSMDEELKKCAGVSAGTYAVALCTCDGQYACMGDFNRKVPIMEAVFPLLYAMAMEDAGAATVNAWAGTEPSSHPPDSFTLLSSAGGAHGGGGGAGGDDDEDGDSEGDSAIAQGVDWAALPDDVRARVVMRRERRRARGRRERRRRIRSQRQRWREMRARGGREALLAEREEAEASDSVTTDTDDDSDDVGDAAGLDEDDAEDAGRPSRHRGSGSNPDASKASVPAAGVTGTGFALNLDKKAPNGGTGTGSRMTRVTPVTGVGAEGGGDSGAHDVAASAHAAAAAGSSLRSHAHDAAAAGASHTAPVPQFGVAGSGSAVLHDSQAVGGVEPSRDPKAMPQGSSRPYNACTLAGALAVMSCVGRGHLRKRERLFKDSGGRFTHVISTLQQWAGDSRLGFNNAACLLLKQRYLRCMAMSHYLKGMEALPSRSDPSDVAHALIQCMCIEAHVRQLATLAATFARAGACPTTDRRCMRPSTVKNTLSMTYTCGMGPLSGTWTFNIALPATVGSTGVTLVVIPGLGGLAMLDTTSERLTPAAPMPARSLKFCEMLVREFRVNMFDALITAPTDSDGQLQAASKAGDSAASTESRPDLSHTLLAFELTTAAGHGDLDKVVSLIKMGADVTSTDYDLRSALHIACCEGHVEIVGQLLRHGADILAQDRWGQTPFAEAVRCSHSHIVTVLESHLVSQGRQPPSVQHIRKQAAAAAQAASAVRTPGHAVGSVQA